MPGGRGPRRRLDLELVRRGLVGSRIEAQERVARGEVRVGGAPATKPSRLVRADEPVTCVGPPGRTRGGAKLAGVFDRLGLAVAGRRALDLGAGTGGFTRVLLEAGAASVAAVDVGHGQLAPDLRTDPRVDVFERTHVARLEAARIGAPFDVVLADLSFISLVPLAERIVGDLTVEGGDLALLVKPQFEVGRAVVSRGRGVVRDPVLWAEAVRRVGRAMIAAGAAVRAVVPAAQPGAAGNQEFFLVLRAQAARSADTTGPRPAGTGPEGLAASPPSSQVKWATADQEHLEELISEALAGVSRGRTRGDG